MGLGHERKPNSRMGKKAATINVGAVEANISDAEMPISVEHKVGIGPVTDDLI